MKGVGVLLPKHARYQLRYIPKLFNFYFLQLSAALPVATKTLTSPRLVNRQVAATPYCSLHHPQGALANVPTCATSRNIEFFYYFTQLSAALPVATKTLTSPRLVNRQVAATPYCSLDHPRGALANVPTCATSRKNISATFDIITDLFLSVKCLYIVFSFY